jgi:hypothetical protein
VIHLHAGRDYWTEGSAFIDEANDPETSKGKYMNAATKAYNQKILAQLQKAKTQLAEFEARSKAEDEQVALDLINQLKNTHHKIDKKREEVERSGFSEMEEEQAEIEAGIAKLRAGLDELGRRLNPERRTKAS